MKNSIIWSTKSIGSFVDIFSGNFNFPIILTTLKQSLLEEYYDNMADHFPLTDGRGNKLTDFPCLDEMFHIQVKVNYGDDWRLLQPKDLKSFRDILRVISDSGDYIIIFSNDLKVCRLKEWIQNKVKEYYENKKVFCPSDDFVKKPELITSFSQHIVPYPNVQT